MTEAQASVAAAQLKSVVERIERLEEEKQEVADQVKEVYAEAKANGFDTKAIRRIVALRKKTADERAEEDAILDLYMSALGMLPDAPLFTAAGLSSADILTREAVASALADLVPPDGEITIKSDGKTVCLWRKGDGPVKTGKHRTEGDPKSKRRKKSVVDDLEPYEPPHPARATKVPKETPEPGA